MKNFTESEIKYLAGLLDADGSLSFKFCKADSGKTFLYLILSLSAAESVDKHGYIKSLCEYMGSITHIQYERETYSDANLWRVQGRNDLNKLLPRLIKHMVVKGKHWQNLYNKYCELQGVDVKELVDDLKQFSEASRGDTGPVKPKTHPTWAWVAGYLDGDGCYTLSKNKILHVGCITHKEDMDGVELLHKAFGGTIYEEREDNTRLWRRGLGKSNKDFAVHFLKKVHRHSRLKKWKIEQMLAFHNQSQRLTDGTATAEVIV